MLYTLIVVLCTQGGPEPAQCFEAQSNTNDCVATYREVLARKPANSRVVSLSCVRKSPKVEFQKV